MTLITPTLLSDGRELIYFDADEASAARHRDPEAVRDARGLPPRGPAGTARYDALSGEWIAVAAHRQSRTHLPPADQCPLCPTTPANLSEVPASDYEVVVFENRFSSFGPDLGELPSAPEWGTTTTAFGRCEVVAFDSAHEGSFGSLPPERARTVIDAWAHRTEALSAMPGIKQVFCFENRGADIGVTLLHPHGQIYAYPFIPPRAATLAARAHEFFEASGGTRTLMGHALAAERSAGDRMVIEGEHFSAFVPFAARWPLEVHLVPHRQVPDIAALTGEERDELTTVYLDLLGRFDALYPTPTPYIAAWQQAPLDDVLRPASYLHLQVTSPRRAADKLKFLAGSEAAMGAFINDTTPEKVAEALRAAGTARTAGTSGAATTPDAPSATTRKDQA
ncbi:galactose-1-phosphate uridylyltransferase [Arthrobacter agilis]|uniref:galactose-1-phosphate uridylyltransferase n=1 Tax=Arthrobacter agilis TaxID=37921 RepID=UPI000B3582B8|nr:galactose-1-phosphate uridylyltransferase [Arthrobacter agilis]OUM40541.1 galactose-1-phosphate uridylyltransferase [Arthrobacter agilis]PPB45153.1 galactose-1-phosphate uridylyltransferase [Arthrobacter agilis]TPV27852.1 galactose-1-phosphate uridylyltransferase [Arthrobacter agilis]VDR31478.1 Galactose-1-phosphate uridylyltransferase [Arthrobacter agilis]